MKQLQTNKTYKAFVNAFSGLHYFFRHEQNGRTQLVIGVFTVILGTLLHISRLEWIAVLLCIGTVLSAEMINSALEKLCDYIQPSSNPQIRIIKDVAAGGVLFISIVSAIIGAFIFIPKLWHIV